MNDDFDLDLEAELERSIAHIVDEETSGAQEFVRNSKFRNEINKRGSISEKSDSDRVSDRELAEEKKRNKRIKHTVIIIISIVLMIALIAVGAYYIVQYAYESSKDNYGYYNNAGYAAMDSKDYENAIVNFEKALTYDEGKTETDMRMFLYECYVNTNRIDKAIDVLYDVLEIKDRNYYNALYYLVKYYDDKEDYATVRKLYEENKNSQSSEVVSLFAIYQESEPVASPLGDTYMDDQKITLAGKSGSKIYYTTDGTTPDTNSMEYTDKIQISAGNTTIKFIAVNQYGFSSAVVTEEYVVNYKAPSTPTIYPEKNSFKQVSTVMVTINNVPSDAVVYFTTDGTIPNEDSPVYEGAFPLEAGATIINVLVVDSRGMTCRTSKTYNVTYVSNVTENDAEDSIWKKLIEKEIVDKKHLDKDEKQCELQYYTKQTIDEVTLYMYYFTVDGEMMDYWYAADDSEANVYKVTKKDGKFTLKQVK